ncbi:enoyl-CoA hydratase-related protein [Variovorax robiniae]|uniref:Enoyl-CoA hydratase-related protein n=1 Tax=Variovorax robiniae TaxID=1836199 RepID=A0ABU8XF32_9BURK
MSDPSNSHAPVVDLPTLTIADGVATVTLMRPQQRNSLRDDDLRTLLAHFARINADASVRVMVLTASTAGQPKSVFCAGYDVGGFDSGRHDPLLFEQVPDALESMRPITLCALNGSVYGGATDIVLACDLRLGLTGTEFRMPAAALGLHYYPSGLRRYVSRLGLNLAKRAFLTARALPCEELAAAGLFEQLLAPDGFDPAVAEWSGHLAGLAPLAAQLTKQSLNEIAAGEFNAQTLRAREQRSTESADFAEGRAAFAARRKPQFTGH